MTGTAAPSRIYVSEIREDMGIGRDKVYKMLKKGMIPALVVGREYIISREAYEQWKSTCGRKGAAQR